MPALVVCPPWWCARPGGRKRKTFFRFANQVHAEMVGNKKPLPTLQIIDAGSRFATRASPIRVEKLAARVVGAFKSVRAEVIALRLQ